METYAKFILTFNAVVALLASTGFALGAVGILPPSEARMGVDTSLALAWFSAFIGWSLAAAWVWLSTRAADIVQLPDGTILTNGTIQNGKLVRG